ncbi:hypothetical protein Tco_0336807 [Tanacetum coccineum]
MGEGSAIPTDPHHTPTISQPSTSQPQKKQRPMKPKRKDTEIPQSSGPTDNVADEAVYKEMDDSLERAATTATSLDVEQDRGNIIKTQSKATPNEPCSPGTSSGGGPRCEETMGDTISQTRSENVSKLSNDPLLTREFLIGEHKDGSSSGDYKFETASQEVREERRVKNSQAQKIIQESARMVSSDEASLGDQEDASKQGRKIDDIDKDVEITLDTAEKEINEAEKEVSTADPVTTTGEVITTASVEVSIASPTEATIVDDLTLAQTLIKIRSAKPKVKGVVIGEQSESTTRTRPQQLPSKDKGKGIMEEPEKPTKKKDQIRIDEELTFRLQAEEEEARLEKIETDELLAERLQAREQEELTIEERAILFQQFLEKRRKHFAAKRAEEKRNKPPTKALI